MAALGLMALGATLFALMNFLARLASTSASWASIATVRALVGALVALSISRVRGNSLAVTDWRALFWRSLLGTISMLLTFYSLSSRSVSLGNIVTLLNLSPVFLAVLAPIFLRERTSAVVAFAIVLALAGVVLVARPTLLFGAEPQMAPGPSGPTVAATIATAVGAALASSVATLFLRRAGKTETPEAIAFHFSLFAAVGTGLVAIFDVRAPSLRDAACMVGAGVCAGFAQLAMTRAYSLEKAATVSGMSYLSVVVSAMLGAVVLRELPAPTTLAGMVLVIVGGLLITLRRAQAVSLTRARWRAPTSGPPPGP